MAPPTSELACLTDELRQAIAPCPFRFEWSNQRQGRKLLLSGDWNRSGSHTTRTIGGPNGAPIRKAARPMTTAQRQSALTAGQGLIKRWQSGADTRQRRRPCASPCDLRLDQQRRALVDHVRSRSCGHGRKKKLLRHGQNLFYWLDERNLNLDSPNAICWAADGVRRDTANYSDRLFVAQWAIELNGLTWVLPKHRRAQKPKVKRTFTEAASDADVEGLFALISDASAETFCRVVAATGCRPSEVLLFDWRRWEEEGRPMQLHGWSPKLHKAFVAAVHPRQWLVGVDTALLACEAVDPSDRSGSEEAAQANTRYSSRMLRLMQADLRRAGFSCLPTWTDLRHLWTIRAQSDGMDRKTAALAQAHSERMAAEVYLRHGEQRQALSGIKRFASIMKADR